MSKSKRVKIKGHGKSRAFRLSDKISEKVNIKNMEVESSEATSTTESQIQELSPELSPPFSIDESVLVIWDDGREGVCHYIPKKDLRIVDRSKTFTFQTRVTYRSKNRVWSGHIPASVSELIECCCMKSAVVDIRCDSKRQVLVLWDNPSAGACHYMYTKDLRIIDNTYRIFRGTRVAFRTKRDITWTGQIPPAIYDESDRGSFNLMAKGHQRIGVRRMQTMVNKWFTTVPPEKIIPARSAYAVIDAFWKRLEYFCRELSNEDLSYIQSLIHSYHRRNRIRSKVFLKRQRLVLPARLDECQSSSIEIFKLNDPLDVIGMESTISDVTSSGSSLSSNGMFLNGLRILIHDTGSSHPSCHSLASSMLDSVCVTDHTNHDNNNLSEHDKTDHESITDLDNIDHEHNVAAPMIRRNSNAHMNNSKNEVNSLNSEKILDRLICPGGEFMNAADSMMKKYCQQFPVVHSDIEEFLTSDESYEFEESPSNEDEIVTAIRRKQTELICVEAKNKIILQKMLRLMMQTIDRQKIEKRLNNVERRIAELTASLVKYLRLKQRAKAKFKCQYHRDRDAAKVALVERRCIMKELSEFDSQCSENFVNLCER